MNHANAVDSTPTSANNEWLGAVKATLNRELPRLSRALLSFPWQSREAYAEWLAQTHGYVVHTTRLTALAAAFVDGPFAAMHAPMLQHASEENGHDLLLLEDLARLGGRIADRPPAPLVDAFVQCLYFQIEHQHPLAIFGRILPLEAIAAQAGPKLYDMVASVHGPDTATFLKTHADADPHHVESAFRLLAGIGEREARAIERGITLTVSLYIAILDGIVAGLGS